MNVELTLLTVNARSAIISIDDGGTFHTKTQYDVFLNDRLCKTIHTTVFPLFGLTPDTVYTVQAAGQQIQFHTEKEFVTLNVKAFGAVGDGIADDTAFLQAAILCCPSNSRVLVPPGTYKVTGLFLKSDLRLELAKNAVICYDTERAVHPVLPGMVESWDEQAEYNLGTWEGNPLNMFVGCINGIHVQNVQIYGEGVIDGLASHENWWENEKVMRGAWRGRLLFFNHCTDVRVFGLTFTNSPSWTIHPYFCNCVDLLALRILNPMVSPNTDGIDVESCRDVRILGVHFTLGDDCVAVKSGKIYMASRYNTPSEHIVIRYCLMEAGHGAVTIGSEMAAGVYHLDVRQCTFLNTDRGLRIKTRRGRGRRAVIDHVAFRQIEMDGVMTPFVVNCFYFCDPDGRTEYVQNRNALPADHRTPQIKTLVFEDITCKNAHVAAAYFIGLPEEKIEKITMNNVHIAFAEQAKTDVAAMHCGIEPMSRHGLYAENIQQLVLQNLQITGQDGEPVVTREVDEIKSDS